MPAIICRECGAQLQTIDQVVQHVETRHPPSTNGPSQDFLCPGCPAAFRQVLQLQRHLTSAHGM